MSEISICITTLNRKKIFQKSLEQHKKFLPRGAELILVEDDRGVAAAKNKCLSRATGKHIFLFDDDTYPTEKGWEVPYIKSPEPHLMYGFTHSPGHWKTEYEIKDGLRVFTRPRGCMMYVDKRVLEVVGGLHNRFGKHGYEHEDWSRRIHKAGLTSHLFGDVIDPKIYCLDQEGVESSVNSSDKQNWKRVTTPSPLYAEYRERPVPVIVARRNDWGHRDRLWRFLRENFWANLPYEVIEGHHVEGKFNRSLGLNLGAEIAGNWDVAIFIDSDVYCDPKRIERAVDTARKTQKLVSVLTEVRELDKDSTFNLLESKNFNAKFTYERIRTIETSTQSNIIVVPRVLYEIVKGFDEQFKGWAAEDNAFWYTCKLAMGTIRLNGPVYHLWHELADRSNQPINNRRWQLYKRCTSFNQVMRLR